MKFLIALSLWVAADDPLPVNPSTLAPSGLEFLQTLIDGAVAEGRIPAAVGALAIDGDIHWLGTAGEMEPGVPMREDAILPLASVGKMFTAAAAMILYERGDLALDDPVSRYIPEFAAARVLVGEDGETVPVGQPITVYHLLTHTGGLTVDGSAFWEVWDAHVGETTTTHFARDLVKLHLQDQPGERFGYGQTGASYEVLGAVIEIASGQTLEEFLVENLFRPLGLKHSFFYLPQEKSGHLPAVYRRIEGELTVDRPAGEDFPRSTFFHGGGGVQSSPADIVRFARLFLDGGAVDDIRILRPETVALMMRDQLGERAPNRWKPRGLSWGFGAAVRYFDPESGRPGQYGWVGGGHAKLWIDSNKRLIAYLNFPLTPPGDDELLREFEQQVYSALAKE